MDSQRGDSNTQVDLLEGRRPESAWVHVVPAVQWSLNTAYRTHHGSLPFLVLYGTVPRSTFFTLASPLGAQLRFHVLGDQKLRQHVSRLLASQEELHRHVRIDFS